MSGLLSLFWTIARPVHATAQNHSARSYFSYERLNKYIISSWRTQQHFSRKRRRRERRHSSSMPTRLMHRRCPTRFTCKFYLFVRCFISFHFISSFLCMRNAASQFVLKLYRTFISLLHLSCILETFLFTLFPLTALDSFIHSSLFLKSRLPFTFTDE